LHIDPFKYYQNIQPKIKTFYPLDDKWIDEHNKEKMTVRKDEKLESNFLYKIPLSKIKYINPINKKGNKKGNHGKVIE